MAGTIKGITVEIGGDTTQLQKALSEVNSKTKDINLELNQVSKLLKLDPSNTTLLAQKQQLLSEAIATSSSKLGTLKSVQSQVEQQFESGDIGESQYRAFERQIESTEISLKKYSDQQTELASGASSTKNEVKDLGKSFDNAGNKALSFGDVLKANLTSEAIINGLKSIVENVEGMEDAYDTIVKKTGASGEALDSLEQTANEVFTSIPTTIDNASEAIGEVNTRFGSTGDELESLSEEFVKFASINDTNITSSVDNVDKAMKVFGVDTSETGNVLGLLTSTAQATGETTDSLLNDLQSNGAIFKEMGLNITQATNLLADFSTNGVDTSTAMAGLKKAIKNFTDEGLSTTDALGAVIDSIKNASSETDALNTSYEIFGTKGGAEMATAIREGRINIDDLSASMSDYGETVDTTYQNTVHSSDEVKLAINNLKVAGQALAEDIMENAAPVITGLVDVLKSMVDVIVQNKDIVLPAITAVGAAFVTWKVTSMVSSLITSIQGMIAPLFATTAATEGATVAQEGLNIAQKANPIGLVITLISALVTALITLWNTNEGFRNAIISAWEAVQSGIGTAVTAITNFFTITIPTAFSSVITWFTSLPGNILQFFAELLTGLGTWAANVGMWITDAIPTLIQAIITFFSQLPLKIGNAIASAITVLETWAANLISTAQDKLPEVISTIVGFFASIPQKMVEIGANIITGLWSGMSSMISWIWDKITAFCDSIVSKMKSVLSIGSPSRVMANEVGQWIPAGIAVGITDNASAVTDAMSALDFKLGNLAVAGSVPNSYSNSYYSTYSTNNGGDTVTVSIGDVVVQGVDNVDDLSQAIVRKLPSAIMQKIYKK